MQPNKNESSANGGFVRDKQELHNDSLIRNVVDKRRNIMTLGGLDSLETKIQSLLKLVQDLKQKNTSLEGEIRAVRQRLESQEELNRLWEKEHTDIQSRIEKVLGDIERSELIDEPQEVSL